MVTTEEQGREAGTRSSWMDKPKTSFSIKASWRSRPTSPSSSALWKYVPAEATGPFKKSQRGSSKVVSMEGTGDGEAAGSWGDRIIVGVGLEWK